MTVTCSTPHLSGAGRNHPDPAPTPDGPTPAQRPHLGEVAACRAEGRAVVHSCSTLVRSACQAGRRLHLPGPRSRPAAEAAPGLAALAPMPGLDVATIAPAPEVLPEPAGTHRDEGQHALAVVLGPGAGDVEPLLDGPPWPAPPAPGEAAVRPRPAAPRRAPPGSRVTSRPTQRPAPGRDLPTRRAAVRAPRTGRASAGASGGAHAPARPRPPCGQLHPRPGVPPHQPAPAPALAPASTSASLRCMKSSPKSCTAACRL